MIYLSIFAIAILLTAILLIVILQHMMRFTNQSLIDGFRLNKIFKVKRARDLSQEELESKINFIIWDVARKGKVSVRNGWVIKGIQNPANAPGEVSAIMFQDNRPFYAVCPITINVDLTGTKFSATTSANGIKDFENMMCIARYKPRQIFETLRSILSGDETTKENVLNYYVNFGLREIL